ncbi:hypothetical protein FISHEDRAFT_56237 [Fistulina hepatica ATCC 64428]|uniref:Uncharacterized protein n=1 Tax=Fistulina hepatica ATCC 64428 TaxID=1128425 RepID=A0A0D7AJQ7_9AGAR|nr:hypothetical protein FISHEDRAFT_56237 [Fistulina hepatica ATCC 64428]
MPPYIGVAIYEQVNSRGQLVSPHWAIVISETHQFVRVNSYHIVNNGSDGGGGWSKPPVRQYAALQESRKVIGIVCIAQVPQPMATLDAHLSSAPTQYLRDRSGVGFWSCESWVVNALGALADVFKGLLPYAVDILHAKLQARVEEMLRTRRRSGSSQFLLANI